MPYTQPSCCCEEGAPPSCVGCGACPETYTVQFGEMQYDLDCSAGGGATCSVRFTFNTSDMTQNNPRSCDWGNLNGTGGASTLGTMTIEEWDGMAWSSIGTATFYPAIFCGQEGFPPSGPVYYYISFQIVSVTLGIGGCSSCLSLAMGFGTLFTFRAEIPTPQVCPDDIATWTLEFDLEDQAPTIATLVSFDQPVLS